MKVLNCGGGQAADIIRIQKVLLDKFPIDASFTECARLWLKYSEDFAPGTNWLIVPIDDWELFACLEPLLKKYLCGEIT